LPGSDGRNAPARSGLKLNILGIESSCDETAASVVVDGHRILSSEVASQVALHHPYGGVVPELASRRHIEAIVPVVDAALAHAGLERHQMDAVAVTQGPGLIGSLLVGFCFARAFAHALKIAWIGIDHLEAHIHSVFLTGAPPPFPFVALLVSGGHTGIYHVTDHTRIELMGQTRDDAAGEAFDKVAKMLGLGYPGGVVVDQLARQGDPRRIVFPRPLLDSTAFDFSFSGLKTAVNRYIQTHGDTFRDEMAHIVAGFQEAVVDVLVAKVIQATLSRGCRHLALVGGVAANSRLREKLRLSAQAQNLAVHIPPAPLCGDNAAMVAAVGYHYLRGGGCASLGEDVYSRVPMQPFSL
jgi:N6-L-threonylcarbamoyladenine synthase